MRIPMKLRMLVLQSLTLSWQVVFWSFSHITIVGFIISSSPNPPFQDRVNTCRMSSHFPNLHILHDYFLEPTGSLETALISCDGLYKSNLNVSHLFSFWLVSVIQLSFWIIPTYWSIPKFTKSSIITWGQYKSCLGTIPKIA